MVFADDGDGSGVFRTVAAAPRAVVIGGRWVEAGAGVVGVASARFFGRRFRDLFGSFGFSFFGSDLARFETTFALSRGTGLPRRAAAGEGASAVARFLPAAEEAGPVAGRLAAGLLEPGPGLRRGIGRFAIAITASECG